MSTPEDEIVEHLIRRDATLAREQIIIIQIPKNSVKCGQVRLLSNSVPDDKGYRIIVVQLFFSHPTGDEIEPLYQFTYYEWLKFNVVCRKYRTFSLKDQTRPIRLSASLSTSTSSMDLRLTMSQEIPLMRKMVKKRDPYPMKGVAPLWLHSLTTPPLQKEDEEEYDTFLREIYYISFLFDHTIAMKELSSKFADIEYRWLKIVNHHFRPLTQQHREQSFLFLVSYIRCVGDPLHDDLLKGWVQFEAYLMRRSPLLSTQEGVESFFAELGNHLTHIKEYGLNTKKWQHYQWHSHCNWVKEGDAYIVSCVWLFEPEFAGLHGQAVVQKGALFLDQDLFITRFIPSLYRHVLLDIVSMVYDARNNLHSLGMELCPSVCHMKGKIYQMLMKEIPTTTVTTEQMHSFNVRMAGSFSAITSAMSKEYDIRFERAAGANSKPTISSMVEMEDLFRDPSKILPPCLSRVVSLPRYKNSDRLNLVNYLVDMGYRDRDKVVDLVCRNSQNMEDRNNIFSLYDGASKKKAERNGDRISIGCDKIIDSIFPEGNIFRCFYEEGQNKGDRCLSTQPEKNVYKSRCACSMIGSDTTTMVRNPLNYIEHKVF